MSKTFQALLAELKCDFGEPLPGRDAQYGMAPRPRSGTVDDETPRSNARRGGVLILFYPVDDIPHLPLILRPTYQGVHSGQVGFPGGGYEKGDINLVATALRETEEEIGVSSTEVTVLGQLSPLYISPSNYIVYPSVGWVSHRPRFRVDSREVAKLIEAPLADFVNPKNRHMEEWLLRDRTAQVPFYRICDQTVWGATAMMLSELLALPAIVRRSSADSATNTFIG